MLSFLKAVKRIEALIPEIQELRAVLNDRIASLRSRIT